MEWVLSIVALCWALLWAVQVLGLEARETESCFPLICIQNRGYETTKETGPAARWMGG